MSFNNYFAHLCRLMKFPTRLLSDRRKRLKAFDYNGLYERAVASQKWVGAHVSAAGGPANAIVNASFIG